MTDDFSGASPLYDLSMKTPPTDSISLEYLKSKASLCPKLIRWALAVQDYES